MDGEQLVVGGEQVERVEQLGVGLDHAGLDSVQMVEQVGEQNFGL